MSTKCILGIIGGAILGLLAALGVAATLNNLAITIAYAIIGTGAGILVGYSQC